MNKNKHKDPIVPIKIEPDITIVDIAPQVEYAIVPKKPEPMAIINDEIVPEQIIPKSYLNSEDYIRPQELLVCRVCLLSECRLYSMRGHHLEEMYRCLFGAELTLGNDIPPLLCAKCASFLDRCRQFRHRSNTAQRMLNSLDFPVTYKYIKQMNDKLNKTFPSLTVTQTPPNHYDFCISIDVERMTTTDITINEIKTECDEPNDDQPSFDDKINNVKEEIEVKIENVQKNNDQSPFNDDDTDDGTDDDFEPCVNVNNKTKKERRKHTRYDIKKVFKIQKFTFKEQLAAIQNRKEGIEYKLYKYKCDVCFRAFNQLDQYEEHAVRHDKEYSNYGCNVCTLRCVNHDSLLKHQATHKRLYSCLYCPYTTAPRANAVRHMIKHEDKLCQSEEAPSTTEESQPTNPAVKLPPKRQSINIRVICEICGKTMTLGQLRGHMDVHNGRTFNCQKCDKVFNNSLRYSIHVKDYHSGRKYECPTCKKLYSNQSGVRRHINTVHKDDNYICDICNRKFQCKLYLRIHMESIHLRLKKKRIYKKRPKPAPVKPEKPDPDRPFQCEHCYKGFKNKPYLQQHLNFVHYKKPRSRYWHTKAGRTKTKRNANRQGSDSPSSSV